MATYLIAGCTVDYTPIYPLLREQMKFYQTDEFHAPDIVLSITEAFCIQTQKEQPHLSLEQCEYIFAGSEFYRKLLSHQGFMLHASAVELDGRAYLFSASSGVGKSTHTKIWQKHFGLERARIINDDKPAIRMENGKGMVYGTPFSGKTDENLNMKVPIEGICFLARGNENRIWRIPPAKAIPLLLKQTMLPRNQEMIDILFPMLEMLLLQVPVYQMECTISEEAALKAYQMMRRNENNEEDRQK